MSEAEKYFDKKNYVTKIIKSDEEESEGEYKGSKITALIELLTLPENRDFREEALLTLKKENAGDLLIEAIKKNKKHKAVLVAACWESEINYSKHLPFFINLALDTDYLVSLEAITVIETMEGPFETDALKQGIAIVKEEQRKHNSERVVLLNDLSNTLETYLITENNS
jgi:hypothetical protein